MQPKLQSVARVAKWFGLGVLCVLALPGLFTLAYNFGFVDPTASDGRCYPKHVATIAAPNSKDKAQIQADLCTVGVQKTLISIERPYANAQNGWHVRGAFRIETKRLSENSISFPITEARWVDGNTFLVVHEKGVSFSNYERARFDDGEINIISEAR
jgi:hypothetical protein